MTKQIDTITAPTGQPTEPWTEEQVNEFAKVLHQIYVMEQQVLFGSFAVQEALKLNGVEMFTKLVQEERHRVEKRLSPAGTIE